MRLILAYGDQEFTDERIKREDWPSLKEKTPLGMVPILTLENGKQGGIHQSPPKQKSVQIKKQLTADICHFKAFKAKFKEQENIEIRRFAIQLVKSRKKIKIISKYFERFKLI